MLSEDALNNLIQPIIDRQESLNVYVLEKIAQRIKEIGNLSGSDLHKLERMLKSGGDVRAINKKLAELTGLTEKDIKTLIHKVAKDSYQDTKPFYDYRHKPFIPFEQNIELQRRVQAIEDITLGAFENLSNSMATGFLIRDLKHPGVLKFQNIGDAYISIIDEAIQASQNGLIDYGTSMRRTINQLSSSGVRKLSWDTGYTLRLDSAVHRNVLDGIKSINQEVQNITGAQFEADGKEITVHRYPAPDHEPIQGHQFTNEEYEKLQSNQDFEDISGKKFDAIERAIGTWNCRHFAYSIIVGISKPIYTPEQLQKIIEQNHEGYTLPNGKHLTMYDCTQKQRQMETKIRTEKAAQIAFRAAGDLEEAKKHQIKINQQIQMYRAFCRSCGLSMNTGYLSVSGYKKMSIK